ncbi:Pyridoxal phosphate homeostasis protein [Aquisphaera giovannonii]|uniref:Pyridoxal phosphate homeostasis protein n=1 Tax=Aquisphaera giovannonii TaxID=406548 RepID=A0A5B9WBF8_9BACT|nr:YggS family pyridoxal phosphate-dependent enzyme [Aquisphaera giovannonii]QEH37803.1 Pyridoxal phosphate homeostasis protein [Aquisphaera giovannonii]
MPDLPPENHARILRNLDDVRARIAAATARSGRPPEAVSLVAVTKKAPVEMVRPLLEAGASILGENYPQELWKKSEALAGESPAPRWHLIGHLQSNKARRTLPLVEMVHAVDSLRLLEAIRELAPGLSRMPRVCLQVNTSNEEAKHGWSPSGILEEADAIAACRAVPIVGLMTMAAWGTDAKTARPSFVRLRETRDRLRERTGLDLPELSMGMSGDFETAIEEGATLVRVGSALFEGVER